MSPSETCKAVAREITTADGARLAAWVCGPETGPPAVLISGGGADHRGWRAILPELCHSGEEQSLWARHGRSLATDLRVAVFDQRATGESRGLPGATSAATTAQDAIAVGLALLDERFAVVGESLGGMAALRAALDHPGNVEALGLLATTAGGAGLTWPGQAFIERMTDMVGAPGENRVGESLALSVSGRFRKQEPALFEALVADALAHPTSEDSLSAQGSVFLTHDVASRLGEIRVPTTILCGTEDRAHPLPNSEFLAQGIRGSQLVVLDAVGHLVDLEAPERVIDEIRRLVAT